MSVIRQKFNIWGGGDEKLHRAYLNSAHKFINDSKINLKQARNCENSFIKINNVSYQIAYECIYYKGLNYYTWLNNLLCSNIARE